MPEKIGPYEPLRRIGAGGMGTVYLALDRDQRTVAVKTLHAHFANEPGMRERLRREVESMRVVRHPRVAAVLDADLDADPPYLVTRYAQGRSLDLMVREHGPLDAAALQRVLRGTAEALAAIHAAGIVHRDLTPRNLMLDDGEPMIIDFGIAHTVGATRITRLGGSRAGSVHYMAPELWEGAEAAPAVDVFAWAASMAFAATGRTVFEGPSESAVMRRILTGAPDLDGLPEGLRALLGKALARDHRDRPRAAELPARILQTADLGTVPAPSAKAPATAPAPPPEAGADVVIREVVTLEDVFAGAEHQVSLADPEQRTVTFRIPPGARTGHRLRLRGQGSPGLHGGPPGDLYVEIVVRPGPGFQVDGDDLHGSVVLDGDLARAGGEAAVSTPGGAVTVQVPPRTPAGELLRIEGQGLPLADGGRGDLSLRVELRAGPPAVAPDAAARGKDVTKGVEIGLKKVLTGTTRQVKLGDRTVPVRIPAGVESGQVVVVAGEGLPDRRGGPNGDLRVHVRVRKKSNFNRAGADLFKVLALPTALARGGGEQTVEGLDGPVEVTVPPRTEPGTELRVPGRGLPRPDGEGRGDLVLKVRVTSTATDIRRRWDLDTDDAVFLVDNGRLVAASPGEYGTRSWSVAVLLGLGLPTAAYALPYGALALMVLLSVLVARRQGQVVSVRYWGVLLVGVAVPLALAVGAFSPFFHWALLEWTSMDVQVSALGVSLAAGMLAAVAHLRRIAMAGFFVLGVGLLVALLAVTSLEPNWTPGGSAPQVLSGE